MKILIIGNYRDGQISSYSRENYIQLLERAMSNTSHQVRIIRPNIALGKFGSSRREYGKWLGYADRFILFRNKLARAVEWADLIHIADQGDAMYARQILNKPVLITCHDLIAVRSAIGEIEEHKTRYTGRLHQRWILSGLRRANLIVCISEATRHDVKRLTGLASKATPVVYNPLNYSYRPIAKEQAKILLREFGLHDRADFLVHVGNNSWYKNRLGAIRIFERFQSLTGNENDKLVVVGSPGRDDDAYIRKHSLAEKVYFVQNATKEQLCAIYSTARALIFPSLYEGFGNPIIEAQACGCPVFTSNRTPMTEVGGTAAIYFDPLDEKKAAECLAKNLKDTRAIVERGFDNVKRFYFPIFKEKYESIYETVSQLNLQHKIRN